MTKRCGLDEERVAEILDKMAADAAETKDSSGKKGAEKEKTEATKVELR